MRIKKFKKKLQKLKQNRKSEKNSKILFKNTYNNIKVVKTTIRNIIKKDNDDILIVLTDAATRTNKIIIHTYQFLKCWILDKYEKTNDIPTIDSDLIAMIFKVLASEIVKKDNGKTKNRNGPKLEGANLVIFQEFNKFYEDVYSKLGYAEKINVTGLSQIFAYLKIDILKNITNNIKMHFFDYLRCYVNGVFKDEHSDIVNKLPIKERSNMKYQLRKELSKVKLDLISNTLLSDEKYHNWINTNKQLILPQHYDVSYFYDLHKNPQKYLKYMIKMNLELEKLKKKQFQVIPLRTEKVIKNIPIDTKSLIELLVKKVKGDKGEKSKFLLDIDKYKDEIWSRFFNLNKSVFRKKNFDFKYLIYTDCFSVSILFLHKSQTEKNKKINEKKKIGRQDKRKLKKGKTPEEKMKMKQDKKKKVEEQKNKKKLERLKQKEEFKKLSKEEKKKITDAKRKAKLLEKQQRDKENLRKQEEFNKLPSAERERIKKEEELKIELEKRSKQDEFPYLEDLTELQTEELQNTNWVVDDPGKIRLLKMLSKDGKVFTYTNRQRMRETKRLK